MTLKKTVKFFPINSVNKLYCCLVDVEMSKVWQKFSFVEDLILIIHPTTGTNFSVCSAGFIFQM